MADISQIEEYNNKVSKAKETKDRLHAELEIRKQVIVDKLSELSKTFGREITTKEIPSLLADLEKQIDTDLKNGMAVLEQIERSRAV